MINIFRKLFGTKLSLSDVNMNTNKQMVETALASLKCKYEWKKEDKDWLALYDYQNGHFGIRLQESTPYAVLSYLFIADAQMEYLSNVRQLCNHLNLSSDSSRFVYSINNETNTIDLHLFTSILLDPDRSSDIISLAMREMFGWQALLMRKLADVIKAQKENKNSDTEVSESQLMCELFLLREQEVNHQKMADQWRSNPVEPLTLGQWLRTAWGWSDVVVSELSVITDRVETINDKAAIEAFTFSDALIKDNAFVRKDLTLNLTFFIPSEPDRRRYMTFFVQQVDTTNDALYYRISSMLQSLSPTTSETIYAEHIQSYSHSVLVAFDLRDNKQLMAEFKYMWQDAKDKLEKGAVSELSDEQRLIAEVVLPDVAGYLYRGRKLYLAKRYYEAILWLSNAFGLLHSKADAMEADNRQFFYDLCYMLGFCYNQIQQHETAFYYLSFTIHLNRITYTEEYINTLIAMHDVRALNYIENIEREMEEEYQNRDDEEETLDQNIQAFRSFLSRQKAFLFIEKGSWDEAEKLLNVLINDPRSTDFALQELAYLQSLRNKKKE